MGKRFGTWADVIGDHMTVADQAIFVNHQPIQPDRASRMGFIRTDTDFSSFAKTKTVGKPGGGVVHHGGRIYVVEKPGGRVGILR